jgi:hypothetical protein
MSGSSLARTQEEGAASGCGDDEDDVQRWIWPARRHDDFREGPLGRRQTVMTTFARACSTSMYPMASGTSLNR